ncbi:hypothetical protein DNTS_027919 [Danionella cerebrum]|uniref:Enamelin n=1 Tax=Danionella cerebrum TaxID=2873325 RepID=A0A553PZ13_9TELE|nr:hypothetical protein DNTS_027919 [Danionella translucida]
MKVVAFLLCLLSSSLAAPAPDSGSNEQAIANHANTALQLMELYRALGQLRQQGFGVVPGAQLPAQVAPAAIDAQPEVSPQAPQQALVLSPAVVAPTGDDSDEEGAPAQAAAPLNSDEAEEAEEAEGGEEAEGAEAALAGPEAEPAGIPPAVDAPAVDAPAVDAPVINEAAPVADTAPAPEAIATDAGAAVEPVLNPEAPVAAEVNPAPVEADIGAGADQVLVAEAPVAL